MIYKIARPVTLFAILLSAGYRSSAQTSPNDVKQAPQPMRGWVVATLQSIIPDPADAFRTNNHSGAEVTYRIVRILSQPAEPPFLSAESAIEERVPQNESMDPVAYQIKEDWADKTFLLEVFNTGNKFTVSRHGHQTIDEKDSAKVAAVEAAGWADVQKIRALPTVEEKVQMFYQLAQAAPTPSLTFVFEVNDLLQGVVPDAQRLKVLQGLAQLLDRSGVPTYVQFKAFSNAIAMTGDRQDNEVDTLICLNLIDAFHRALKQELLDQKQLEFDLVSLQLILRRVVTDPDVIKLKAQLRDDLYLYRQKMLGADAPNVSATKVVIQGVKTYRYQGPANKVKYEVLTRPLLDIVERP